MELKEKVRADQLAASMQPEPRQAKVAGEDEAAEDKPKAAKRKAKVKDHDDE